MPADCWHPARLAPPGTVSAVEDDPVRAEVVPGLHFMADDSPKNITMMTVTSSSTGIAMAATGLQPRSPRPGGQPGALPLAPRPAPSAAPLPCGHRAAAASRSPPAPAPPAARPR